MKARYAWYRSGDLFGIKYWLPKGAEIPTHTHERQMQHNIIVLEGVVELHMGGYPELLSPIMLSAGVVFDFDNSRPHKIVGWASYSVILNMFLHGIPEGYDALPQSEHEGVL